MATDSRVKKNGEMNISGILDILKAAKIKQEEYDDNIPLIT